MDPITELLKIAGVFDEMDVLARAQFLEGYVGARPFARIRGAVGKTQLLNTIGKMISEIGVSSVSGVSPLWASNKDTGLYRSVFMAMNRTLAGYPIEAGDVLQSLMGMTGWTNEEGEAVELGGKNPFWYAGKFAGEKKELEAGKIPSDFAGRVIRLANQRAIDVIRSETTKRQKALEEPSMIEEESMSQAPDRSDWGAMIDAVFANSDHPVAKKFFAWLEDKVVKLLGPGTQSTLIRGYLDLLKKGLVADRGDAAAAAMLGDNSQGLWNAKNKFETRLSQYLVEHPRERDEVRGMFENAGFLQSLMQGQMAHYAAKRLAARFAGANVAQRFLAATSVFKVEVSYKELGGGGPWKQKTFENVKDFQKWVKQMEKDLGSQMAGLIRVDSGPNQKTLQKWVDSFT